MNGMKGIRASATRYREPNLAKKFHKSNRSSLKVIFRMGLSVAVGGLVGFGCGMSFSKAAGNSGLGAMKLKPGLYEIKTSMRLNGAMVSPSEDVQKRMQALPAAVQSQMQHLVRQQSLSLQCVEPKMLEQAENFVLGQRAYKGCRFKQQKSKNSGKALQTFAGSLECPGAQLQGFLDMKLGKDQKSYQYEFEGRLQNPKADRILVESRLIFKSDKCPASVNERGASVVDVSEYMGAPAATKVRKAKEDQKKN